MKIKCGNRYIIFPDDLSSETYSYIRKLLKDLSQENILSAIDDGMLLLLGNSYNTYLLASEKLAEEGHFINDRPHPAIKLMKDAQVQITKLLIELNKIRRRNPPRPTKESSPIEKFINQKREIR